MLMVEWGVNVPFWDGRLMPLVACRCLVGLWLSCLTRNWNCRFNFIQKTMSNCSLARCHLWWLLLRVACDCMSPWLNFIDDPCWMLIVWSCLLLVDFSLLRYVSLRYISHGKTEKSVEYCWVGCRWVRVVHLFVEFEVRLVFRSWLM
jgi:hypothetical protein